MIPPKLYLRMTDLQEDWFERADRESEARLIDMQDAIGWPWKASQLQLEDWDRRMEHMT